MQGRQWWPLLVPAGMVVVAVCLLPVLSSAGEQTEPPAALTDCRTLATQIEEDNRRLHQELRQIKRELALLNQNLEKPGSRELIAGIGFILGLFGAAALVATRRQDRKGG